MGLRRGSLVVLISLTLIRATVAKPARLPQRDSIPILAWQGVPEKETSEARYREMADCGFTIGFSSFSNIDAAIKALDAAKVAGVQVLVSCPQLETDPVTTVDRLKSHPALAGYFLGDEPETSAFASEARWIGKIRSVDPDHIVYINLLPNYATSEQLHAAGYLEYVDRFAATVPTTFLSFDYYPIVGPSVRPNWYENLEIIAAAARKADKPFWAFALSLRHYDYPAATRENLREQVYSNLAYGAQGIQYFTYWQPTSFNCGDSPIDANGKRTAVYDRVKEMNAEIRARSSVFVGCKVVSVGHTGEHLPTGTRRVEPASPIVSVRTEGTGAIVSRLSNGSRQFLVIVNRDVEHPMPMRITFDRSTPIDRVERDGAPQPLHSAEANAKVEPGDAMIFSWSTRP